MYKLYKRNTNGSIQVWYQEINNNQYRTISGKLDGKLVYSEWTTTEPKNIGKSNEISAHDQVIKEVEANYTKKLKSGYFDDVNNIDNFTFVKPMLAKNYEDYKPSFDNLYSEPKLDGIRCITTKNGMFSRTGETILSCPHIFESLKPFFDNDPDLILDGELYNHDFKDDFNSLQSMIVRPKVNDEVFEKSKQYIQYWIYDIPSSKESYEIRNNNLKNYKTDYIQVIENVKLNDENHLNEVFEEYLDNGFEGQMIKVGGTLYENKRSKFLLKHKVFHDDEYPIVDIIEGKGNRYGLVGKITLMNKNGTTFNSDINGTREYLREVLLNKEKYIGKDATVKYFNLTPDGVPRFAKIKAIHENPRM